MGTVDLENPMDKRYFYALNPMAKWVPSLSYVPYLAKNGYMAESPSMARMHQAASWKPLFIRPSRSLKKGLVLLQLKFRIRTAPAVIL